MKLSKAVIVILIAAFITSLTVFALDEKPTVAIVTGIEGDVTVVRDGKVEKEKVEMGSQLYKGDMIVVGTKGKSTVYFMDGSVLPVDKNQKLILGSLISDSMLDDGSQARALSNNEFTASGFAQLDMTNAKAREMAVLTPAAFRAYGVVPAAPYGNIYDQTPIFIFVDSNKVNLNQEERIYVLIIVDEDSNELFRGEVKGKTNTVNRVQAPGFTLDYGTSDKTFYWDIYRKGEEPEPGNVFELEGVFTLIDKATAEKVKKSMADLKSLLAQNIIDINSYSMMASLYLKNMQLYYDSILYLEQVFENKGESVSLFEQAAWLYSNLGNNSGIMVKYYSNLIQKKRD